MIITGIGSTVFSADADIKHLNRSSAIEVREFAQLAVTVTNKIEILGKGVVAAINGHAYGGGQEVAEACMLRVAVSNSMLGHPQVRIGVVAGSGCTTWLGRLIGKGRAAEKLLRGRAVAADEALQIGLVQSVVAPARVIDEAEVIVRDILAQSPVAVHLSWEILHRELNLSLEESTALGADFVGLVASTKDFRTGTRAFIDMVRPVYVGR